MSAFFLSQQSHELWSKMYFVKLLLTTKFSSVILEFKWTFVPDVMRFHIHENWTDGFTTQKHVAYIKKKLPNCWQACKTGRSDKSHHRPSTAAKVLPAPKFKLSVEPVETCLCHMIRIWSHPPTHTLYILTYRLSTLVLSSVLQSVQWSCSRPPQPVLLILN